MPAAVAVLLG